MSLAPKPKRARTSVTAAVQWGALPTALWESVLLVLGSQEGLTAFACSSRRGRQLVLQRARVWEHVTLYLNARWVHRVSCLPPVSRLVLAGDGIDDQVLRRLTEPVFRHVHALRLYECPWVTDAGVTSLSVLQLRELELERCLRLTDACLPPLTQLPLTALSLAGCTRVTDDGLAYVARMKDLRRLNLSALPDITDDGLEQHISSLSLLQALDLSYNYYNVTTVAPFAHVPHVDTQECFRLHIKQ